MTKKHFNRLVGHRGGISYLPENSLAAFQEAVKMGASYIELDIHFSADGEPMLMHDNDTKSMTGKSHLISETQSDVLKSLRLLHNGKMTKEFIPTFAQVCEVLSSSEINLIIELKAPQQRDFKEVDVTKKLEFMVSKTVNLLERYGMVNRAIFCSLNQEIMRIVNSGYSHLGIQTIFADIKDPDKSIEVAKNENFDFVGIPKEQYSKTLMGKIRQSGLKVYLFTIENSQQLEMAYKDGVDLILPQYLDASYVKR